MRAAAGGGSRGGGRCSGAWGARRGRGAACEGPLPPRCAARSGRLCLCAPSAPECGAGKEGGRRWGRARQAAAAADPRSQGGEVRQCRAAAAAPGAAGGGCTPGAASSAGGGGQGRSLVCRFLQPLPISSRCAEERCNSSSPAPPGKDGTRRWAMRISPADARRGCRARGWGGGSGRRCVPPPAVSLQPPVDLRGVPGAAGSPAPRGARSPPCPPLAARWARGVVAACTRLGARKY